MAPKVRTFPPFITASKWQTANIALKLDAERRNGLWPLPEPRPPKLTNAEALKVIMAMYEAAGVNGFPLWYQYAAVAYGWSPERDRLDTSAKRAAAWYPEDVTRELFLAMSGLALDLEVRAPSLPRWNLDAEFSDPTIQGLVANALRQDGATVAWKIPLPACKDPKTGKPTGRPHKDKNGKWTCDPVVVDDPITKAKKDAVNGLAMLAMLALVAWALND